MPETAWYESFFSGLWLDVQRTIRTPGMTSRDADVVERGLGLEPGAAVLDAPCGEGRVSLELAARGYAITGVDFTRTLLDEARAGARERGLDVTFDEADVRALPYDGVFDGAFCFWGSFGYFDDVGNVEQARLAARALRPSGRYLIDTPVLETVARRFEPRGWVRVGEILLLEERRWDHAAGRMESEWTMVRDGVTETRRSSIRIYSAREIVQVLLAAGFKSVDVLASPGTAPFGLDADRACVVATKGG